MAKERITPGKLLKQFSPKKISNNLSHLSTPQISDALMAIKGSHGTIPQLKPLLTNNKIFGKALTVKTESGDWGTALKAIDLAEKGDLLVIYAEDDENALWGELTSRSAQKKGIVGTVVYGAVRDVESIKKIQYPVFYKSIVPNAGKPVGNGDLNVNIQWGDLLLKPGDMVVGDDSGVVVVPQDISNQILTMASKIKQNESEVLRFIDQGLSLSQILDLK